jgi:hypothetical protein
LCRKLEVEIGATAEDVDVLVAIGVATATDDVALVFPLFCVLEDANGLLFVDAIGVLLLGVTAGCAGAVIAVCDGGVDTVVVVGIGNVQNVFGPHSQLSSAGVQLPHKERSEKKKKV